MRHSNIKESGREICVDILRYFSDIFGWSRLNKIHTNKHPTREKVAIKKIGSVNIFIH